MILGFRRRSGLTQLDWKKVVTPLIQYQILSVLKKASDIGPSLSIIALMLARYKSFCWSKLKIPAYFIYFSTSFFLSNSWWFCVALSNRLRALKNWRLTKRNNQVKTELCSRLIVLKTTKTRVNEHRFLAKWREIMDEKWFILTIVNLQPGLILFFRIFKAIHFRLKAYIFSLKFKSTLRVNIIIRILNPVRNWVNSQTGEGRYSLRWRVVFGHYNKKKISRQFCDTVFHEIYFMHGLHRDHRSAWE